MTKDDLEDLGFNMVDENEYSNSDFTIFILDNDQISIIGEREDNFLSVPVLNCKSKKQLVEFLKLVEYDILDKNKIL